MAIFTKLSSTATASGTGRKARLASSCSYTGRSIRHTSSNDFIKGESSIRLPCHPAGSANRSFVFVQIHHTILQFFLLGSTRSDNGRSYLLVHFSESLSKGASVPTISRIAPTTALT